MKIPKAVIKSMLTEDKIKSYSKSLANYIVENSSLIKKLADDSFNVSRENIKNDVSDNIEKLLQELSEGNFDILDSIIKNYNN